MTSQALQQQGLLGFDVAECRTFDWKFLRIEPFMIAPNPDRSFMRRLGVAQCIAFKVWRISRILQLGAFVVAAPLLWLLYAQWRPVV